MGWDGIADHYRTNYRCIARWVEECGGDELRRERSQVSGIPARPTMRSERYRGVADRVGQAKRDDDGNFHVPTAGTWLKTAGGAYRLLLNLPRIAELEEAFAGPDPNGSAQPKSIYKMHDDLSGGWNEMADAPLPFGPSSPAGSASECVEVLRQALIGGGMAVIGGELVSVDRAQAQRFLDVHILNRPVEHARKLASIILSWTIFGPPSPASTSSGAAA
ncbi:hypothetical protein ASE86_13265 [Sphingomonas sp. Leaf33]|uniref:hypothetical protein n=1 Tax=Sphingomonas sp. Leaf33 TaxID=1736215 RepID=UPI0006F534BC|nr:hypothetical protein [Sphingomonas sp. Leaf33]KQN19435.1 hypothetical protein ASE86_13265 [Sphingomonas sp. Leaf33]